MTCMIVLHFLTCVLFALVQFDFTYVNINVNKTFGNLVPCKKPVVW